MKVQKIVRASGEWAKSGVDFKDGDTIKFLDGGQVITGEFGDQNVFKIETKNGEKNLGVNQTSMNNLIDAYGDDTDLWKGKGVKAWLITQSVSGKMKKVCYLTAEDWGMIEDEKGNLRFAKLNGAAATANKVMNTPELTDADIPF